MTPERYARVEELFHAALELPAERRPGFLTAACGLDVTLRDEVQSLLQAHAQAGDFVAAPLMNVSAGMLTQLAQPEDAFPLGPYVRQALRLRERDWHVDHGLVGQICEHVLFPATQLDLGMPLE